MTSRLCKFCLQYYRLQAVLTGGGVWTCEVCPLGYFQPLDNRKWAECRPFSVNITCARGTGVIAGTRFTDVTCFPCQAGKFQPEYEGTEPCRDWTYQSEEDCGAGYWYVAGTGSVDSKCVLKPTTLPVGTPTPTVGDGQGGTTDQVR